MHENELRVRHLALLTEHHLHEDKVLQMRRYVAARRQDDTLTEVDRNFLTKLEKLAAEIDAGASGTREGVSRLLAAGGPPEVGTANGGHG